MAHQQERHIERLSFTVDEFMAATGYNRRRVYSAIASGALKTFKDGRRRMVSAEAARAFIALRERETAEAEGR